MNTPDQNKKDQQEKDFPGYPTYPASDDVMNQDTKEDYGKLNNLDSNADNGSAAEQRSIDPLPAKNTDVDDDPESTVSPEDIAMLSASDQGRDMESPDQEEALLDSTDSDGDPLNEVHGSYDKTGSDLDVPGSESDDANEDIGSEDEENNFYSLGGDNHENLEEDTSI